MKSIDSEELLSRLAEAEDEDPDEAAAWPTEALLADYRAGRLPPEEEERLELAMARDRALRHRLLALAAVRPVPAAESAAIPRVREAVLAAAWPAPRRGLWAAAAALVAAAILPWLLLRDGQPPERPLPEYAVEVAGLAVERDGAPTDGPGSAVAQALPQTRVSIVATAEGEPVAGVDYGLYRQRGARLERLPTGGAIEIEARPEAVVLEAEAEDLVGEAPGTHTLFVVVARQGELPRGLVLATGEGAVQALEDGGARRVLPVVIELKDPLSEER